MSKTFIRSLCSIVVEPAAGKGSRPIAIEKLQPHFLLNHCFICLYFNGASRFNIERNCFLSGDICIHCNKGCLLPTLTGDFSIYLHRWRFPSTKCFSIVLPPSASASLEDAASRLNRLRDVPETASPGDYRPHSTLRYSEKRD